jgi:hypothetical protein
MPADAIIPIFNYQITNLPNDDYVLDEGQSRPAKRSKNTLFCFANRTLHFLLKGVCDAAPKVLFLLVVYLIVFCVRLEAPSLFGNIHSKAKLSPVPTLKYVFVDNFSIHPNFYISASNAATNIVGAVFVMVRGNLTAGKYNKVCAFRRFEIKNRHLVTLYKFNANKPSNSHCWGVSAIANCNRNFQLIALAAVQAVNVWWIDKNPRPLLQPHMAELKPYDDERSNIKQSNENSGNYVALKPSSFRGLWSCLDSVSYPVRLLLIVSGLSSGIFFIVWGVSGYDWRRFVVGLVLGCTLGEIGGNVLVDWFLRM